MENTFTIPLTETQITEFQATPSTWQLALEFGTPTQPARVTVLLNVRDSAGEWRAGVTPVRVSVTDTKDQDGAFDEPRMATIAANAILDATIPAQVAAALGMREGATVREMGQIIIEQQMSQQAHDA